MLFTTHNRLGKDRNVEKERFVWDTVQIKITPKRPYTRSSMTPRSPTPSVLQFILYFRQQLRSFSSSSSCNFFLFCYCLLQAQLSCLYVVYPDYFFLSFRIKYALCSVIVFKMFLIIIGPFYFFQFCRDMCS